MLAVLMSMGSAEAAIQIDVKNHSFELPSLGSPPPWLVAEPDDWYVVGRGGTWNVGSHLEDGIPFAEAIPDGSQVAYSNGGMLAQTLDATILADMLYTLDVAVGFRQDIDPVVYQGFPPNWSVGLYSAGDGTLLASLDQTSVIIPIGYFEEVSLDFVVPDAAAYLGDDLQVRLYSSGLQTNFDNVRVTQYERSLDTNVVPEPASLIVWTLLGAACAAVVVIRRRRRVA